MHQYHDALKYYKIFRLENDSLFNKDKERDLSEMRFKYDSERQENLIKQSKLDVMQKEQRIQQQTFYSYYHCDCSRIALLPLPP